MKPIQLKLSKIRNRILIAASEVACYSNWADDVARKNIVSACNPKKDTFFNEIEPIKLSELLELSKEELYAEGFGNWDDLMILIPIWLINFIDGDETVFSIMGKEIKFSEADNDHRGGMLAYGFYPVLENS
jgi:hypothetical protein